MREVLLGLLHKEPSHGYELKLAIESMFGELWPAVNIGQVYQTLSRLERQGLVRSATVTQESRPDKKVYELTASGRERVEQWLADVTWSKVAPLEFHLKLVAAAATRLADPVALVDAQRLELLRELRQLQELALAEPPDSDGALLIEGASLRLQADIRWLEACERRWVERGSR